MSIISEALKKAQKERTTLPDPFSVNGTGSSTGGLSAKERPAPVKRASLRYHLMIAASAVAVLALIIAVPRLAAPTRSQNTAPKPASILHSSEPPARDKVQTPAPAQTASPKPVFPVFRPAAAQATHDPEPVLNGIMYLPTAPQAVINGRTVKEGDKVDGYTVINILPDRVKLSSENGESELELR